MKNFSKKSLFIGKLTSLILVLVVIFVVIVKMGPKTGFTQVIGGAMELFFDSKYDIARKYSQLPITDDMKITKYYTASWMDYVYTITLSLNPQQSEIIRNNCRNNPYYEVFGVNKEEQGPTYNMKIKGYGIMEEFDRITINTGDIGCYRKESSVGDQMQFAEFNKNTGQFSMLWSE